ncbi:MAG: hypothetical protein WDA07_10925 [Leucobacter sp.]
MTAAPKKRRPGRPRSSGQTGFRIEPVWKQDFDRAGFARALLLLAIHLDETGAVVHKKEHSSGTHEEGEHHE